MKIFCDFDDTLVKSSKRVVEMINLQFGTSKSESDVVDWGYKSIYKNITRQEVYNIFDSERFFDNLDVFDGAIEFLSGHTVEFCTIGSHKNLNMKVDYLNMNYPNEFIFSGHTCGDKSSIDMSGGVQIDDKVSNLENTNAKIKILFKNFNNFVWQKPPTNSNIYMANTWKEIKEIVDFLEVFDG